MKIYYVQEQMVTILTIAMTAFFLMHTLNSHGDQKTHADKAVQHLIVHAARSDLTFIRNDEQFTAKEAAEHMQRKYTYFREKITTPEDFIELCATRSLLSGKPYLVINEKGAIISTNEWLSTELVVYRNSVAGNSQ